MLPSTGYFKGINCPFYDSGLCERPYCHFRHVKKESLNANDGIESGAILQKLVSAAVQKVLQQTDSSSTANVNQVATIINEDNGLTNSIPTTKVTYNPTPISELNKICSADLENNEDNELRKRHIPVPYTPRKPASIPLKRPPETNGSSKPFIYNPPPVKYSPGSVESVQIDPYTPKGTVESKDRYLPGTQIELQEYTPKETVQQSSNKHSYIPSDRSVSKKKILEYKPTKVNPKTTTPSVTYQPTPRSQVPCFSSDEDEPDNKKRKISSDLNGLDDLGPEFDILDQILDEETQEENTSDDNKTEKNIEEITNSKDREFDERSIKIKEKEQKHKSENEIKKTGRKHSSKSRSDKTHKSSSHDKEKGEHKNKSSDKLSHKSSTKNRDKSKSDKNNDEKYSKDKKDRSSSEKRHSSSSKTLDDGSKHRKSSSKDSAKHSKHSSSSKSKGKVKDRNHKSHKSLRTPKQKDKKKQDDQVNDFSDSDNNHQESVNLDMNEEELSGLSDSDEETRALECKKIFEEYVPEPVEKTKIVKEVENKTETEQESEYIPSKKRISRTTDKNIKIIPRAAVKPDFKVSAAQTMAERLQKVREFHASKNPPPISDTSITLPKTDMKSSFSTPTSTAGSTKIRIAHVPYASTMMNAKKSIQPNASVTKSEPSTSSTVVQTIKKGAQRVAHVPNDKFIDRPGVLEPLASKIAANIRSTYLNMMIDECLKIYLNATDAYARAQHEELATSKKCSTVQIYKNSAVLTVSRLRKELQECNGVKKSGADCTTLQKIPQTISGKSNTTGSWSIENKNRKLFDTQEFIGPRLYNNIKKWILTEEQLRENGFPRSHPSGEKGRATIYSQNKQKPPKGYIRTCCRCKKDYTVDKKGFPVYKEECIYHPNNKYRVRGEARYQCCSQDATSDGCCIAPSHVYEYVDYDNLRGYVKTLPPDIIRDDYGVYSLDCEMCYTTHGLDLTRVTVINSSCKVVYETLIKPLHPIIDYNTRYSGITEEQMSQVRTTLLEVQATLLTMFNSKTILIGHSLESDFKALKLIHETVIDTSVLFPHKMGPPYKRALRNLSSEHLKKIIQNSVDGHDSAEDATVCMELVHYKLKEDLKTR
ncbi:RNA exonuclease 1 homolog [Plodia interpunctella]|uniref:RNA exonuclease 1 homolog n=1 Tax=Plodia interpunctella TaxID=58824 RepID=UPI002368F19F|nr:RNA exonuclease 1 homolog [Plodia interpunctella]